ncbi:sensor histidine kinase [Caldanaerobacter subterraneus]|uniref:Signal transduction histidine-protein kinase ArlS n=1 Tax=Caldanaerobacter subterraneus TaxID=911092 RepID=A0A7Y2L4Y7_9THEO|nr:ATP-binding protein [Caldanaerobacter subterraneus]NNG65894.1 HAMP domain-containing protein [Caldanaerobacter subterraneus]
MKIKLLPQRITLKIALLYSAVFSFVLIFLNAAVLYTLKYYLIYQSMEQVSTQAEVIKAKLSEAKQNMDGALKDTTFSGIPDENIYVKIFDSKGRLLYLSKKLERVAIPYNTNLEVPVKVDEFDKDLVYLNTVFKKSDATFYIQVIKDMKNEYAFLKLLFILMFFADGAGIFISFVTGYFVTKRALRPVDYMIKEVKEIDAKGLNKRLKVYGEEDELTRLAKTFNDMLDRLEESFARQNRFVSDASHELRTPISVIKGYIDMLDRWGKDDREVLEEGIKAIKKETLEMESLVEKLLFLAKGDDRSIKLERESFDLKEIAEEVVREIKLIYEGKNVSLKGENVRINADKKLIKEVLRILLDNAAKYTSKNGNIEIEIGSGDEAYIKVKDDGIGIPEEDLPYIFERFYRVDKARSKDTGGTGLGLSIAKWIVEEHGGVIGVKSEVGKGTEFTVMLPLINDSK